MKVGGRVIFERGCKSIIKCVFAMVFGELLGFGGVIRGLKSIISDLKK